MRAIWRVSGVLALGVATSAACGRSELSWDAAEGGSVADGGSAMASGGSPTRVQVGPSRESGVGQRHVSGLEPFSLRRLELQHCELPEQVTLKAGLGEQKEIVQVSDFCPLEGGSDLLRGHFDRLERRTSKRATDAGR
jgi:hypothetical protein